MQIRDFIYLHTECNRYVSRFADNREIMNIHTTVIAQ